MKLSVDWMRSLGSMPARQVDEITADGHAFANRRWFELVENLNTHQLVGGECEVGYSVVSNGPDPIAIAPVMHVRGSLSQPIYSLRRYFFEHWTSQFAGDPQNLKRLLSGVNGYRRFLEMTGTKLDECLLVTNPPAYRCSIPIAPSAGVDRLTVLKELIHSLQRRARQLSVPIWFLFVDGADSRLTTALDRAGFAKVFHFVDHALDLEGHDSFEDYAGTLDRRVRRSIIAQYDRLCDSGLEFEAIEADSESVEQLAAATTLGEHRASVQLLRPPMGLVKNAQRCLPQSTHCILAKSADRVVGFSLLMSSRRRGELWSCLRGRTGDVGRSAWPVSFGLNYAHPIQYGIEHGYRRLWLGPASCRTKSILGATQLPLYSYFWFPRLWDRAFLQPYLSLFGQVARRIVQSRTGQPLQTETSSVPVRRAS